MMKPPSSDVEKSGTPGGQPGFVTVTLSTEQAETLLQALTQALHGSPTFKKKDGLTATLTEPKKGNGKGGHEKGVGNGKTLVATPHPKGAAGDPKGLGGTPKGGGTGKPGGPAPK